jgi:hypothetical protein
VMSVPGSTAARLPSAGTGYANLVMAGDWTLTAISSGCVEAAVMSGMHASRALCGAPAAIVGDDLPDGGDVQPIPPPDPQPFGAPGAPGAYVELDGNATPCQPYTAQGVTMYNFVLEADYDQLVALLDRQLNHLGAPVIYRPLGPFVAFVAATMGPMAPASPRAWLDEKDFGFWIPVIAGQKEDDGFKALRPAFYVPYLWVDSHLPQQAGREVFGYPKGVGILRSPASPQDPAELSLDALVVPRYGEAGDPDARWQWRRLVTAARRDGGALGDLVHEVQTLFSFGKAMIEHLLKAFRDHTFPEPSLALLRAILGDLIHLDVPMVFLKQFRDVADGTKACYQAIVEASNRMARDPFRGGFLHGDWELTVEQFASVRIIDHLGLRVVDGKIHPAFAFWVQMAFTAEPGQVVWRVV